MTRTEMQIQIDAHTGGTNRGVVPLRDIRGEASVEVRIVTPRWSFGRIDVLVEPVAGSGTWWIALDRLQPVGGEGGK